MKGFASIDTKGEGETVARVMFPRILLLCKKRPLRPFPYFILFRIK